MLFPLTRALHSRRAGASPRTVAYAQIMLGTMVAMALPAVWPPNSAFAQTTVLVPQQQNNDFQEATLLYRKGQYQSAMERVDAWLKARPKDARGRFLRGM